MLILAIAFLGMFALLAAGVLSFASGVQHQRTSTEATASIDSATEGAAQFAMADTGVQGCGVAQTGTMNFPSRSLSYDATATGACNPSSSGGGGGGVGQNCGLCVLNIGNTTATPVDVHKGNWNVPGEVDVNGGVNVQSLTAGAIGLFGSTSCNGCSVSPVSLSQSVLDPLAGALPIPTPGTPKAAAGVICPGTYTDLTAALTLDPWGKGPCMASSAPSLYIITGTIGGNNDIVANGSTLYLTSTANFDLTGNGTISIDCGGPPTPSSCPSSASTTPATGPYAGVAVFMDPGNTSTMEYKGNGSFFVSGTFEASHAILDMKGNGGTQSFQSGRLIISEILGNGNGGAGLGFGGTVNSSGCNYWNDLLTGTVGGSSQVGHVRFETACNAGSPTSIISFAYGNGP